MIRKETLQHYLFNTWTSAYIIRIFDYAEFTEKMLDHVPNRTKDDIHSGQPWSQGPCDKEPTLARNV